nr:MAG: hypothetical protein KatS3mg041_2026 [Bacteroidota bacterium]
MTIEPELFGATVEEVRRALEVENIEARPVWKPLHMQPVFRDCEKIGGAVAESLFAKGLCLPSGSSLYRKRSGPHYRNCQKSVQKHLNPEWTGYTDSILASVGVTSGAGGVWILSAVIPIIGESGSPGVTKKRRHELSGDHPWNCWNGSPTCGTATFFCWISAHSGPPRLAGPPAPRRSRCSPYLTHPAFWWMVGGFTQS